MARRRGRPDPVIEEIALEHCKKVAQAIVDEIRSNPKTPTDQGFLRNSYSVEYDPGRRSYVVVSDVPYWKYVEFGTGHGPEQMHVRPAIEVVRARGVK